MKAQAVQKLTMSALLVAISVVIPMFSPLKIAMEPASFTLASHVPIFLAMFISPGVSAAVAVGATAGFFFGPFSTVVALRAASHLVFAFLGALYLRQRAGTLTAAVPARLFSLVVALIHAVCEVAVVTAFYVGGSMGDAYYQQGFFRSVMLLVGFGTVVHSMVDFELAMLVAKVLAKQRGSAFQTLYPPMPVKTAR